MRKEKSISTIFIIIVCVIVNFPVLFCGNVRLALDQRMFSPWSFTLDKNENVPDFRKGKYNRLSTDSNFWYQSQILKTTEELKKGRYPSWDPTITFGTPLAAQLGMPPFYPFNWLLLLWNPMFMLGWLVLIHMILGSIFTRNLILFFNTKLIPATFGGIAFGIGPWMAFRANNYTILATAIWIPLLLECALRLGTGEKKLKYFLLISISSAFSLLAGMPQIGFIAVWAGAVAGIWKAVEKRVRIKEKLIFIIIGILTGILLASPEILPTKTLYENSIRSKMPGMEKKLKLNFSALLGLLSPDIYGSASDIAGWETYSKFPPSKKYLGTHVQDNPLENCIYVGTPIFILFLISIFSKNRNWMFIFFSIFPFVIAMRIIPFDLIYKIPGFGPDDPRRILVLFHLFAPITAATLLDNIIEKRITFPTRKDLGILFFYLFVFLFYIIFFFIYKNIGKNIINAWVGPLNNKDLENVFSFEKRALLFPLCSGAAFSVLILFIKKQRKIIGFTVIGICILEFIIFNYNTNPAPSIKQVEAISKPKTVKFLVDLNKSYGQEQMPRIIHVNCYSALRANIISALGIPVISASHPLPLYRPNLFLTLIEKDIIDPSIPRGTGFLKDPNSALHPYLYFGRIGYFCCTSIETANKLESIGLKRIFPEKGKEYENEGVAIFKSPIILPRARMYFTYKRASSLKEAYKILKKGWGPPVVESKIQLPKPLKPEKPPTIKWLFADSQRIKLKVNTQGGIGLLLIADTFYPGWRAFVDKKEVKIFPVNIAFRGIFIDKGEHIVEMVFLDEELIKGVVLFIFAGILLGFMSIRFKKTNLYEK